ncbi:hypothetical protein FKM82_012821 [Ascaphus truei]
MRDILRCVTQPVTMSFLYGDNRAFSISGSGTSKQGPQEVKSLPQQGCPQVQLPTGPLDQEPRIHLSTHISAASSTTSDGGLWNGSIESLGPQRDVHLTRCPRGDGRQRKVATICSSPK